MCLFLLLVQEYSTHIGFSNRHSSSITDHDRQNSGKATVLGDAARVLRDLVTQVESLRKEQSSLLTEHQYVSFQNMSASAQNLNILYVPYILVFLDQWKQIRNQLQKGSMKTYRTLQG
jgi:hypothetical protein